MSAAEVAPADRLEFSQEEILSTHPVEEQLVAGGVRCHGGYVGGEYISPRTLHRVPAVLAWQERLGAEGQPLIEVPDKYVPPQYPSVQQSKLLLQEGVRDPITRALTTVSIVEGFGARIREVRVPDLEKQIKEELSGTALNHLTRGLFEAHARDEAGHREEGGHKQMWEAARDVAIDNPEIPGDVLARMMGGGGPPREAPKRLFPEISNDMEAMITMMSQVLVVEIFAENVFEWAKALLGDPEVSADHVRGAALVAAIQSDEKPHVDYLRTALSELRARTIISEDGKQELLGSTVVDGILERQLRSQGTRGPEQRREQVHKELREELEGHAQAGDIVRRFEAFDSGWTFPDAEGKRLDILLPAA